MFPIMTHRVSNPFSLLLGQIRTASTLAKLRGSATSRAGGKSIKKVSSKGATRSYSPRIGTGALPISVATRLVLGIKSPALKATQQATTAEQASTETPLQKELRLLPMKDADANNLMMLQLARKKKIELLIAFFEKMVYQGDAAACNEESYLIFLEIMVNKKRTLQEEKMLVDIFKLMIDLGLVSELETLSSVLSAFCKSNNANAIQIALETLSAQAQLKHFEDELDPGLLHEMLTICVYSNHPHACAAVFAIMAHRGIEAHDAIKEDLVRVWSSAL